jgi:hypothetical protein
LSRLMEWLFEYLTSQIKLDARQVAETLWHDYQRGGRRDKPSFLREFKLDDDQSPPRRSTATLKRQSRHLATGLSQAKTA